MSETSDRAVPSMARPLVVHLFPGQGDFAVSPLVRAVRAHPVVRTAVAEVFEQVDEASGAYGIPALGPALLGAAPPSGRDLAEAAVGTPQAALFGASLAVHRALCAVGAAPDRLVAVSFGEIPALTAAGVFDIADGTRIACRLARILSGCSGGMTLLGVGEAAAARLIATAGTAEVAVACVNDPGETVVSGPLDELIRVEKQAAAQDVEAARLRLPFLTHHPSLTAPAQAFHDAIGALRARPGHTPLYSAVHGGAYGKGDDVFRGLADCVIHPVRLPHVLSQAAAPPPALLLEAGTGQALTRNARRFLTDRQCAAYSPLSDPGFPWERPHLLHPAAGPGQPPAPAPEATYGASR
ncbi:acyltransferase domain-containing protein [Streptomyces sp. YGL11-2]|uniref:acyltransferase domain-containing protein n=1 Tax=Streptomyces sp. YGL11-2 TaxID=3414028 RepID=UPI003CF131D8